jgi:hypothetical protein
MSRTPSKLLSTIFTRYTINSTVCERTFTEANVDDVLEYFSSIDEPTLCVDYIGIGGDFSKCKVKETTSTVVTDLPKKGRGRPKKLM